MGSFPSLLLICCCNDDSDVLIFIFLMYKVYVVYHFHRRGALIIRRLCVLLNAERVYRELSTILEGESDLDFASTMVQVAISNNLFFFIFSKPCIGSRTNESQL